MKPDHLDEEWSEDADVLARISRHVFGQPRRVWVRLPRELANRAVAAWQREENESELPSESPEEGSHPTPGCDTFPHRPLHRGGPRRVHRRRLGMMGLVATEDRFEWLEDVSPANWIRGRLHPSHQDVGSVIPGGFEAYSRIFHPVESTQGGDPRYERWSDTARSNRRIVHPEMQFHLISHPPGRRSPDTDERGRGVSWGSLPLEPRRVLVAALRDHTTTPDRCWFCVWEGYGLDPGNAHGGLELPQRRYLLHGGPVEAALVSPLSIDQSPNLWWPEDRAWFVATEIDYAWTYVGGSRCLVELLLAHPGLEALQARLSDKPFHDSDLLNAALDAF